MGQNDPACAGALQRLNACTAKNALGQKCEIDPSTFDVFQQEDYHGFKTDVYSLGMLADAKSCESFYASYELDSLLNEGFEDCYKGCDAEMKALARCGNGFEIKNDPYGAGFPSLDCVCANNAPPNKVTCKPGNWRAPATLPKDICEAGTFCDVDCAQGYANFDEAKGCANAGKGYCCKDTKPAKYPFTPNTK